jgi:hypothetical protein
MLACILAVGITASLSSCMFIPYDPPRHDPMALRFDGSELLVVACESITATDILMSTRGPDTDDEWVTFFEVEGSVDVTAGDEFSMAADADAVDGMAERFSPTLPPGTEVSLLFADNTEPPESNSNYFEIGDDGVPDDGWLQWDGSVTEAPCGYDASP